MDSNYEEPGAFLTEQLSEGDSNLYIDFSIPPVDAKLDLPPVSISQQPTEETNQPLATTQRRWQLGIGDNELENVVDVAALQFKAGRTGNSEE